MVTMSEVFSFPNPVNQKAARVLPAGSLSALATLVTGWNWLIVVLALGFLAVVVSGPTLSVLG